MGCIKHFQVLDITDCLLWGSLQVVASGWRALILRVEVPANTLQIKQNTLHWGVSWCHYFRKKWSVGFFLLFWHFFANLHQLVLLFYRNAVLVKRLVEAHLAPDHNFVNHTESKCVAKYIDLGAQVWTSLSVAEVPSRTAGTIKDQCIIWFR